MPQPSRLAAPPHPLRLLAPQRGKPSLGQMLSIMVLPHGPPHQDCKDFWPHGLAQALGHCFAQRPSTGKFVVSMPPRRLPLTANRWSAWAPHFGAHQLGA